MQQLQPPPVFLFDGDCAFCSATAQRIDRWVPGPTTITPWQWTDLEPLGVTVDEVDAAVVMVDVHLRHRAGPEALADLLTSSTSTAWRAVGRVLGLRPVLALAWPTYRLIARNRHRLPGGTAQCSLPQAERHLDPPA